MTNALFKDSYDMDDLFLMVCEGVADKRIDRAIQVLRSRLSEGDIAQLRRQLDDGDAAHAERFRSFDDAKRLVYHWKDEFPSPKNKFIQGIVRMQVDMAERGQTDQTMAAAQTARFQQALKLLCTAHSEEYDENLNGLSMEQIVGKFRDEAKQSTARDREAVAAMRFTGKSPYRIARITSFEEAQKYGDYTSWCITHYRSMWDSYSQNGLCPFYFCLREGFENEREVPGDNAPLDSYGLSMIAVCVNMDGSLKTCTVRWNHGEGGNDQILDAAKLSQIVGMNFYETFRPLSREETQNALRSGGWKYVGGPRYTDFGVYVYKNDFGDGLCLNSDFEQVHILYDKYDYIAKAENGRISWNCGAPPPHVHAFVVDNVSSLEGCPESVERLEIYNCPELKSMAGAPRIKAREPASRNDSIVYIHECPGLETLEGWPDDPEGQRTYCLSIMGCQNLKSLKGIPSGMKCDRIVLSRLNVPSLHGLPSNTAETIIEINACNGIESLAGLPGEARGLSVFNCSSLKSLDGAPRIVHQDVAIRNCAALSSLSGFPSTPEGGSISLSELPGLASLEGLGDRPCHELEVKDCVNLKRLNGCPRRVEGEFLLRYCGVESLEGGPEYVGGYYIVSRCYSLVTTKGVAKSVGGPLAFDANRNLLVMSGVRRTFGKDDDGMMLQILECPSLKTVEDTDAFPVANVSLDTRSRDLMIRNNLLLYNENGNPITHDTFDQTTWKMLAAATKSHY